MLTYIYNDDRNIIHFGAFCLLTINDMNIHIYVEVTMNYIQNSDRKSL